jgi:hypothetical protein
MAEVIGCPRFEWSYLEIRCIFLSPDFREVLGVTSLCAAFLRRLSHRPGGYGNAVEDYWLWLGRSLMGAHPYLSWLTA